MEAINLTLNNSEVKPKPASGVVTLDLDVCRGFAANDPRVHRGCSGCSYDVASDAIDYNWFRYYDPKTGRYITSDRIGLGDGPNTYLYGQANPLKYTDPTGEAAQAVAGCVAGAWAGPAGCGAGAALATLGTLGGISFLMTGPSQQVDSAANSSSSGEQCCTVYKDIYEPNPKHGNRGYRNGRNQWISPEPKNPTFALANAVPINERRRVGYDPLNNELVEFRLTRKDDVNCIKIWHGFVISNQPTSINSKVKNAAKGAGFPVK